jgi:hypothetical protein
MLKKILLLAILAGANLAAFAAEGDTISLDEKWLFRLFSNEKKVAKNVSNKTYNDTQWGFQAIPGFWRVPGSLYKANCVGVYRGWVKMPETFVGRKVYLHIGNTTAVTDIYMNGQLIGKSVADRAQTEFEITSYLTKGRNLFAFVMPRWDAGQKERSYREKRGFMSECYLYALNADQNPTPEYVPKEAGAGVVVVDRYSFEPQKSFLDTREVQEKEIAEMKKMGFKAVTYNKLGSDPQFIELCSQNGIDVVSTPPATSEPFFDANHNYTEAAYNIAPTPNYNYKKEISAGEKRANALVSKPKPKKKESSDLFAVWDTPYSIQFDKHTGLISSYTLEGVSILSSGCTFMPNAQRKLVSFTYTKPNKNSGTKATAVFDIDGKQVTWDYEVQSSGVLSITMSGEPTEWLAIFAPSLTKYTLEAKDFNGTTTVNEVQMNREGVVFWKQTDANGRGVEIVGQHDFSAHRTAKNTQWIFNANDKKFQFVFLPVAP